MLRYSLLLGLAALVGCGDEPPTVEKPPALPPLETPSDLVFTEPKPVPGGVVLRLNPKADLALKYSLVGAIDISAVPGKESIPADAMGQSKIFLDYEAKVASADAGSVTFNFESGTLKMSGKAQGEWEQLGGQKGQVQFDRRGGLLADPESLFEAFFGSGMILFPESPIGPGSTWSSENTRDMPPFGPVKVKEEFKYAGKVQEDGVHLYKIDSTATGSIEGMKMSATYFIREDGMPYSASFKNVASTPIAKKADGTEMWAGISVDVEISLKK